MMRRKEMKKICKNCQNWQPIGGCESVSGCSLNHDVIRGTDHCKDDFKPVEPKKVYLLRQGDSHLTSRSLVIMGIFDSEEALEAGVRKLLSDNLEDNFWDWEWDSDEQDEKEAQSDYIESEVKRFFEDYQTYLGDVLLICTEVEVNIVGEV